MLIGTGLVRISAFMQAFLVCVICSAISPSKLIAPVSPRMLIHRCY